MMPIDLQGELFQLLPQRAVFWKKKKILIVADIHLGKASAMQNAGIPLPEGAMDEDLKKLKELIEKTKPKRCLVIGDLIHTKLGLSERVQLKFKEWLSTIPCSIELILGNHDRALIKKLPEGWNLIVHKEQLIIEGFCFTHIPTIIKGYYVWSGHIHPQVFLKSHNDQLTLRCFSFAANQAIIPAFSDFVGGCYIERTAHSQIYVIAENQVIKI